MSDVELVNMPIPRPLLPRVTALINEYWNPSHDQPGAAEPSRPVMTDGHAVEVPENGWWDQGRVAAVLDGWHNAGGRELVEAIARRTLEGQESTTWGELQQVTGQSSAKARSNLGALSKRAIKAVGAREWPMHCTDLGNAVPSDDRYVYRMPLEVARWVLEVQS